MSRAFAPGLLVDPSCLLRKRRELPIPGTLRAKLGDRVQPTDIVAEARLPGELQIVRVAEQLGILPQEVVTGMQRGIGEAVQEGEVLVEHRGLFGLFRSRSHSPVSGVLEFMTEKTGHLGIRLPPRALSLFAYMSGEVVEIEEGKSLVLEEKVAFLQGIFGLGGERNGILTPLDVLPETLLLESHLPEDCSGKILFGGTLPQGAFLREAARRGAQGLITGGIDGRALKEYLGYDIGIALTGDEEISMSVIITEGFGPLPLSKRILSLLQSHSGRLASISGATQVRAGALRPECIIPLEDAGSTALERSTGTVEKALGVGAEVRIIRYPFFGIFGKVHALPEEAEQIETGAFTRVVEVYCEDGCIRKVPRANIELV